MTQCSGWQSPGWNNPNLLINWDFRNPVNQRGQTYYNNGYGIDMWMQVSDISVKDGYISIKNYLVQKFEQDMEFGVKQYIFSCALKSGAIYAAQIIDDNATYAALCEGLSVATQNNELYLWSENRTTDIQAVKLEIGSISTLALDLMQPSDYAAELRKCQRYFQKGRTCRMVTSKTNYDNDTAITDSEKLSAMRIEPTITLKDIWVPGYYDINQVDSTKFVPKLCSFKDNKSFYVGIEKQGMDNFDNLLGRCIIFDYEASAEL